MVKAFISRLTYFLLPVIFFACLGDFFVSRMLRKSKTFAGGEYSTWNAIYDGQAGCDIVVYGSSRAVAHFDINIIQNSLRRTSYNLGMDGHNFWMQYFRHTEFLRFNDKPNVILYSLDVTSLTEKGELYNADQFLPYMLLNNRVRDFTGPYHYFSMWDYYVPVVRFFGKERAILHALKLSLVEQPDSLARFRGYYAQQLAWNSDLSQARARLSCYNINIDTSAVALFKRFLEECRDLDIKVVLVYSPQYIEGQQFVQNKNEIMETFRNLSKAYDIPFLDYSGDSICLSKEYFYNSGHLNKIGAELFSKNLCHDLKAVLN